MPKDEDYDEHQNKPDEDNKSSSSSSTELSPRSKLNRDEPTDSPTVPPLVAPIVGEDSAPPVDELNNMDTSRLPEVPTRSMTVPFIDPKYYDFEALEAEVKSFKKKPSIIRRAFKLGIGLFDSFGGSMTNHPGLREKSCLGACISISFRVLFLLLIIVAIIKISTDEPVLSQGNTIVMNRKSSSQSQLDYPAMHLYVNSSIFFFEKEHPALQKVSVIDRSGISGSKSYTSSSARFEKTVAVYDSIDVPLGSYTSDISRVPPSSESITSLINLRGLIEESTTHKFLENTVDGIKVYKAPSTTQFFNHSLDVFVRIPSTYMNNVKQCMLQIGIANTAEYEALAEDHILEDSGNHLKLTSLSSSTASWHPDNFKTRSGKLSQTFTVLRLNTLYEDSNLQQFKTQNPSATINMGEINNWNVFINYNNNFKTVSEESLVCTTSKFFRQVVAGIDDASGIGTTGTTATIDYIDGSLPDFCPDSAGATADNPPPVKAVLTGQGGREIVTITASSYNSGNCDITFTRASTPVNFTKTHEPSDDFFLNPPSSWTCPSEAFYDEVCDCGCGYPDPACDYNPQSASCRSDEICSYAGVCISRELSAYPPERVAISEGCRHLVTQGESLISGFVGDPSSVNVCPICPGDALYNYEPQFDQRLNSYICNYAAYGQMYPKAQDYTNWNTLPLVRLSDNPATDAQYFKLKVKIPRGPQMPLKTRPGTGGSAPANVRSDKNPYSIMIGSNLASGSVTFQVVEATARTSSNEQIVSIVEDTRTMRNLLPLLAHGYIISGFSRVSSTILVDPEFIGSGADADFLYFHRSSSPIPATIAGKPHNILSAQNITYKDSSFGSRIVQVLTIDGHEGIRDSAGAIVNLQSDVSAGDTTLNLEFDPTSNFIQDLSDFLTASELFIYDSASKTLEKLSVTSITKVAPNAWTCDPGWYNDGFICDCDCGTEVDPDCFIQGLTPREAQLDKYEHLSEYCDLKPGAGYGTTVSSAPSSIPTGDAFWNTATTSGDIPGPLRYAVTFSNALKNDYAKATTKVFYAADHIISRYVEVKVVRKNAAYKATERHLSTSNEPFEAPSSLPIEIAAFLQPKKKSFSELNLCPSQEFSVVGLSSPTYVNWEYNDNGPITVNCDPSFEDYPLGAPPDKNAAKTCEDIADITVDGNSFMSVCPNEMPPHKGFNFNVKMPVNYKYSAMKQSDGTESPSTLIDDPEYIFSMELVYTFIYDSDVDDVEVAFAQSKQLLGDTTPDGTKYRFFGALAYRDIGVGNDNDFNTTFPAQVPLNRIILELRADYERSLQVMDEKRPNYWSESSLKRAIENHFANTRISFDASSIVGDVETDSEGNPFLPLAPGYLYTISGTISITPKYQYTWFQLAGGIFFMFANVFDEYTLDRWIITVGEVSVERQRILGSATNEMRVRFQFQFNTKAVQLFTKRTQTVSSLVSDIGSAVALLSVGLVFLGFFQKRVTCLRPRYLNLENKKDRKKRLKREKELKKRYKEMKKERKLQKKKEKMLKKNGGSNPYNSTLVEDLVQNPLSPEEEDSPQKFDGHKSQEPFISQHGKDLEVRDLSATPEPNEDVL